MFITHFLNVIVQNRAIKYYRYEHNRIILYVTISAVMSRVTQEACGGVVGVCGLCSICKPTGGVGSANYYAVDQASAYSIQSHTIPICHIQNLINIPIPQRKLKSQFSIY